MEQVLFMELLLTSVHVIQTSAYLTDWNMVGSRLTQPMCVDIPKNLTLCHGIGYNQMRLPNLLGHDTMVEVAQQAGPWVPLFNLKCHPDTQLFLCSLFSPVCLDRPIYPCRSLCEAVREGCERRMSTYGYPWPDMVRCDQFPLDNDMCITVQSTVEGEPVPCIACNQPDTYENMIDNFCRADFVWCAGCKQPLTLENLLSKFCAADFVIKTRIRRIQQNKMKCGRSRILTFNEDLMTKEELVAPTFVHPNMTDCCGEMLDSMKDKKNRVLIMGDKRETGLKTNLVLLWGNNTKVIKRMIRIAKKEKC
ncbi:secreted frizzled-related protein 1-like isoform X2 [Tachypleus tridentatus]|uniref:secreted frizzled-related protein 1-like isoform X2 n=1 Tax=Tachypleus tridentatus TaxID=6853 RepID=UPI003FD3D3B4